MTQIRGIHVEQNRFPTQSSGWSVKEMVCGEVEKWGWCHPREQQNGETLKKRERLGDPGWNIIKEIPIIKWAEFV